MQVAEAYFKSNHVCLMLWHIASQEKTTPPSPAKGLSVRNICGQEQCPPKTLARSGIGDGQLFSHAGCEPRDGWWGFLGLFQCVGRAGSWGSRWPSGTGRMARPDAAFLELMGSSLASPAHTQAACCLSKENKSRSCWLSSSGHCGHVPEPRHKLCLFHFSHLLKSTWSVSFCFENKHPLGFHTL